MSDFYIGLMSGTSLDGVSAAIVDFSNEKPRLVETYHEAYLPDFRQRLLALTFPGENEIERLGLVDRELGEKLAEIVLKLIAKSGLTIRAIAAVGSHGQAIRHRPDAAYPFTLQIGDPNTIVSKTGLTTVADFRRADIALGGQGAPLAPAFHPLLFANPKEVRVVLNIGGIANITVLDPENVVKGFDTGPGNRLLDDWIEHALHQSFDKDGSFARKGRVDEALLKLLLDEPYFSQNFPKSTGRELFNFSWLQKKLKKSDRVFAPEDVQATLVAFTAKTIAAAIETVAPKTTNVIVCGGGVHNTFLLEQLSENLKSQKVKSAAHFGFDPDWVEAAAFAWLAKQTLENKPGNLPSVTGAKRPAVLGGVWRA
ncbi:MAG: anhydro-N-acetylmuramic acid kinase [Gammaproteobacteria bacterium RIFCSPLOWO2_12_FULL_38_14]|nr:MAG: anhydro-N-acetylmuramic acid kinase [Gammaproteobacteria bacterium RIFCSPLOWO2_12_FULL_38_14]